jgi:hypothetical protein
MSLESWIRGPVGLGSDRRVTRVGCRDVLVMVPTMTSGTRLMDVVPLFEADHRIQVVFTVPHAGELWQGTEEFVQRCAGAIVPWAQAIRHRWDLVVTASHRHIEQVHGRILVMPHGAGATMSRRYSRKAGNPTLPSTGLDRELLTFRGRVIPACIALTHDHELDVLRRTCPEALPMAVVAGDLCLDRMMASWPLRRRYRLALGIADDEELVTISSTWSPESTFGRHPEIYQRILDEADGRTRVAAVLHPNIWAVHGAWQVHAWLAEAIRRGLLIIPPEEGWRATMIASDRVIGDHGSTTCYAGAIGRPVWLATFPDDNIHPGSIAHALAGTAPRLDHGQPLLPQLRRHSAAQPGQDLVAKLTARPGQAADILRTAMYRLLELPKPPAPPLSPLPMPLPTSRTGHNRVRRLMDPVNFAVSCGEVAPGAHRIRWSVTPGSKPLGDGLIVEHAQADRRWVNVADVVVDSQQRSEPQAEELTRNLFSGGQAVLVVANLGSGSWLARSRDSRLIVSMPTGDRRCPLGWAAWLYQWLLAGRLLTEVTPQLIAAVGYRGPRVEPG